jgi:hypothetical protein
VQLARGLVEGFFTPSLGVLCDLIVNQAIGSTTAFSDPGVVVCTEALQKKGERN